MPLPDGPVFGLPPGADFPGCLARGLVDRMPDDPVALARVTVILNTVRMRARFLAALTQTGARLLPRVVLVTDLGALLPAAAARPAVPSVLSRQLLLAQAIRSLISREPDLAPQSARFALAEGLVALIDEAAGEGVPLSRILALDLGAQSAHWQRSLAFLRLAVPLAAAGAGASAAAAARANVEALAAIWAVDPPADPVILAGSTGSRGMTATLMQAVAALPRGAVVLPGFDRDLPAAVWSRMTDRLQFEDHPQFRHAALLQRVGQPPEAVQDWTHGAAPDPARNRVVSLALRPAPVTDQWLTDGQALADLPAAMAGVTLVEADTPRDEAAAVALVLRQAVADGRTAALVTPDRNLARRVTALLDCWGIVPDDSAGRPLAMSAPGRMLRMTARSLAERMTTPRLLALLRHPFTALVPARGDHQRLVTDLELDLRRRGVAYPDADCAAAWAAACANPLAPAFAAALRPLFDLSTGTMPLGDHLSRHLARVDDLTRETGAMWQAEAGVAAQAVLRDLAAVAEDGGAMTAADHAALIDTLLARVNVTEAVQAHPGVFIWGTIEARVQGVDRLVLGGLNEGVWPAAATPDHWLNRAMRRDAGLLLPERAIGLAAHDFQQAMGAAEVTLSRARRAGEAETVASRWVNRLTGVLAGLPGADGPQALAAMRDRGRDRLAQAVRWQAPQARVAPALRPKIAPPAAARPARMAVTDIVRLVADPYAVYARRVLHLRPLDPLQPEPDPRTRGTLFHDILDRYARALTPDADRAALLATIAAARIADAVAWPLTRVLWQARFLDAVDGILAFDDAHPGDRVLTERKGQMEVWPGGSTLTARPDRIDMLADGRVHLIDYKGAAPEPRDIESHQKQLLLEAVIAHAGGFGTDLAGRAALTTYLGLNAPEKPRQQSLTADDIAAALAQLRALLQHYADPATGFAASRIAVKDQRGDYDDLARRGEWDLSDSPVLQQVGTAP